MVNAAIMETLDATLRERLGALNAETPRGKRGNGRYG